MRAISIKENVASALTHLVKTNSFIVHLKVSPNLKYESLKDLLHEVRAINNHQYKISLIAQQMGSI